MRVVIVIPTYNEAENLAKLLPVLLEEFNQMPNHDCHVLIVDGKSPDGTGDVVKAFSQKDSRVHLFSEPEKRGLGAAYVSGFKYAMSELNAEVLVEMDGDFQHDPKDIKKFITKFDEGYDYVIGSRFTHGGSIPKDWALYRKVLSWGGNLFSKMFLGIFSINDFTSGFKASRVHGFVDKLNLDSVLSQGFAYKIDLLFKMHKLGARFVEVPIKFGMRDRGDSKMEKNNLSDSLKVVLLIRFRESQSFFRFLMVGIAGFTSDILIFNIFSLFISANIASAVSGFLAILVTFTLNNHWSFGATKMAVGKDMAKNLPLYIASSYIPIVFRSWLVGFAQNTFGPSFVVKNTAFVIGVAIGLVWNFTVYSRIIWKQR